MSVSYHDWQQAPEDVLPILTETNQRFLKFCNETLLTKPFVFQMDTIDGFIAYVIRQRDRASTPLKKQSFTLFLQYLLNQITENFDALNIVTEIHSRFYDGQPTQQHLDQHQIPIPAIILSGHMHRYANRPYTLCGLNPLPSLQLCHLTYTLIQQKTSNQIIISKYFQDVMAILNEGMIIPNPTDEGERYRAYITFLYQCFDVVAIELHHISAIEYELTLEKYKGHFQLSYIETEYRKRNKREIRREDLANALNTYKSESWVGWIFNTLLCGLFGKHQSYTISALNTLLQKNQAFYQESQIREIVQKSEPKYAEHRLSFFAKLTETTCGTDKVLRQLDTNMVCRM